MARNPQILGRNFQTRSAKMPSLRLSDVARSTTTDYAEILVGDGVPSGGYGRDSGATMVYLRKDAAGATTAMYLTANGGTAWTAMTGTSPAAAAVTVADAGAYFTAAEVEAALQELFSAAIGGTSSGVRAYTDDNIVTDDQTLVASIDALDVAFRSSAFKVSDPGDAAAIPVTHSSTIPITTAAAETNTMAIPTFLGQRIILVCDVYAVGDRVITVASAINVAGNTIMTFGAARDGIELKAIQLAGVLAWEVVWNNGVALS